MRQKVRERRHNIGSPALTYFCENGHIVLDVPHHYIAKEPTRCPICKSRNIKFEAEWGDPDYEPGVVPGEPIGAEKKRRTVYIPIYDVSKLFRRR